MLSERQAIDVFGALAQATRLKIVRALVTAGPAGLSAGLLADAADVSPSNLSFHLRELERADLVASTRQQRSIVYVCKFETLAHIQTFLMKNCCAGSACATPPRSTARTKKAAASEGRR
ncbi:MAG: metalloregulator ArsR/SmtB family transcription factor [Hyphomicrobium sp.]